MGQKILVADDSITIQKVIGLTFANEDYELESADNGDEALEKAKATPPDLIIADTNMPGLSGYDLCEKIRSLPQLKDIPVVLLTGTYEVFDEGRAEQVGASDYLTKPFESQTLIEKVRTLLSSAAAAPEAPEAPAAVDEPEEVFELEEHEEAVELQEAEADDAGEDLGFAAAEGGFDDDFGSAAEPPETTADDAIELGDEEAIELVDEDEGFAAADEPESIEFADATETGDDAAATADFGDLNEAEAAVAPAPADEAAPVGGGDGDWDMAGLGDYTAVDATEPTTESEPESVAEAADLEPADGFEPVESFEATEEAAVEPPEFGTPDEVDFSEVGAAAEPESAATPDEPEEIAEPEDGEFAESFEQTFETEPDEAADVVNVAEVSLDEDTEPEPSAVEFATADETTGAGEFSADEMAEFHSLATDEPAVGPAEEPAADTGGSDDVFAQFMAQEAGVDGVDGAESATPAAEVEFAPEADDATEPDVPPEEMPAELEFAEEAADTAEPEPELDADAAPDESWELQSTTLAELANPPGEGATEEHPTDHAAVPSDLEDRLAPIIEQRIQEVLEQVLPQMIEESVVSALDQALANALEKVRKRFS